MTKVVVDGWLNALLCPFALRIGLWCALTSTGTMFVSGLNDEPEARRRVDRHNRLIGGWLRLIGWSFFWVVGVVGTTTGVMQVAGVLG